MSYGKCVVHDMYEFILWNNCKNNCRFCWQKQHYEVSDVNLKIKALSDAYDMIISDKFEPGSHVLFVGGEIFETQPKDVREYFLKTVDNITDLMLKGRVSMFYINTNLLNTDESLLFPFLDIFKRKNIFDRLKFTTSFDKYGRFVDKNHEDEWRYELNEIKHYFPECNVVINTILTRQFCEYDLGLETCTVKDFMDRFGFYTNLLPYVDVNDEYTPSRNLVFKTLKHTDDQIDYLRSYITNFDLPQKKIIYRFVNGEYVYSSAELNKCGHSVNFSRYSNHKTCYICDLKELFNVG